MSKTRLFMIIAVVLLSLTLTWTVLAANSAQGKIDSTAKIASAPAESNGIEAVSVQYTFSSSSGTYTEIVSGTVHGNASNDDTSFNSIDLGFTFHFNNVDYTQVSIQSNGFIAMGSSVSSSYTPLSTGSSNNVIAALGRDIEGNDTTSTLTSKTEGTAPNRVFTVQWLHYRRYGSTYLGDDFNFQIKVYETSNLVEFVYGPFAFHDAATLTPQVGLRGDSNSDFNNRTTTTDWTASIAGTTNADTMALSNLVFPPTGLTYDWTPVSGAFLLPATQSGRICKGSDVVYNLSLVNDTGTDTSFALAYTSIWPYSGPAVSPVIPDGGSWAFQVSVHIPWSANAGDVDFLTVTATGGGETTSATLTTTASNLSNWTDYSNAPRPVRSPSIVHKDGKLYKIGGYDGAARAYLDIYDIATDTWTQGADLPGARYWIDCEAIGDGIYCAGGYSTAGQTTLYKYDVPTNTWSTLAPLSSYRYSYASVTLNGKYYVIGGYGAGYPATIWEYDPATDTWNYGLPNMAAGRRYHSAGVIGGKIYVAGGYNPTYLSSVEIYDPVANAWSAGPSMPTAWLGAADGVFDDRYLILAGGDDNSTATASNQVWVLDAVAGTWSAGPNMAHVLYGAEGDADASGVWVVTGRLYDGVYSYSPYTSKLGQCDITCTPVSGLDFTWDPLVPWTNFPVSFDASYTAGSPAINFDWIFGDGETGQGELIDHTYLLPNTYTVGLTATNCDGANTATASHNVTVILPPTISINPDNLVSTQFTNTVATQPLEICNVGDDALSWEIDETDGMLAIGSNNTTAPVKAAIPEDIIRLEDDSVDCAAYENYTGYEPAEVAAACPTSLPSFLDANPQAPTDTGYALDIGYISDNFVTFTLNNFAGQTVIGQNATPFYGMDFDPNAQVLYALNDTTDELGTIDLTTGAFTGLVLSPPGGGAANWTGLSIDPNTGVFYASTATNLFTIDPATGVSTLVGPFGTSLMIDIAVNIYGEMYGHDIGTDSIYSIDTTTGAATLIGPTGQNANYAQGMDFDNDDGTLYIFLYIGSGVNIYGTVDLTTGTVYQISNTPLGEFEGAVQIPGIPFDLPWLSESPITGTLSGGSCQTVDVTFDSTGLSVGQYLGGLEVTSNDPTNPTVPIPVTLNVVEPVLNYDTSAKFAPAEVLDIDPIHYTVIITNTGNIAGLDTLMTDVIPAGATYVPGSVSCSSGNCWFDSGANTVFWNGQVGPGGMFNSLPAAPASQEYAGVTSQPDAGWPGPDGYGYTGSSVAFNWIDITTTGTPIPGLTDDNYAGPFPIGFNFDFYGAVQSQFYASSNGFISFGAGSSSLSNQCPLPSSTTPDNLIAMMWDDINFNVSGNAYYQTFSTCPIGSGTCLVVEYANTAHYGGTAGSAGTWEAVLYPNGNVILQYLDPGVEFGSSSTEGIEDTNYAADYGLTYACDAAASLAPNTAALFNSNATPPNPVMIEFDVMATACPSVIDNLAVLTDPQLSAPVQLTASTNVTCATFPDVEVTPAQLSETLFPDEQATQQLNVCNVGDAPLEWTLVEYAPPRNTQVVLYDNGPLVTHPAACSGMDASRLQTNLSMNTLGFGHQFDLGYRMADDFVITDPQGWQIDQITFFAYQTGAPVSPSPINGVYYQIWNGPPNDPSSSIVFGDLVTNRLLSSTSPNLQRDSGTTQCANNRYIFADVASAGVTLPAGTYWIEWATDGNLTSGPWAPPITILGQVTTGNAMQYTTAWAPALDSGTNTQQGMPFVIEGSIAGGTDIPWLSENPTSGTVLPSACTLVDVTFDSTGLVPDTYTAALLVNSNDPDEPTVNVPVTLTVLELLNVEFVYNDLEDVVLPGESVYLAGSFTDWFTGSLPMVANADNSVFSLSVPLHPGSYEYKYIVYTDTVPSGPPHWDWLQSYPYPEHPMNREFVVTGTMTIDDYRDIIPGYFYIAPEAVNVVIGTMSEDIHGYMWAWGFTVEGIEPRALKAELGWGSELDPSAWTTWTQMTWNGQVGDEADHVGNIIPTQIGVFSYAVRYNANWGTGNPNNLWYYADTTQDAAYDPTEAGILTVTYNTFYLPIIKRN